ncbi:MAG: GNAT family N-acetyltransferase [Crocinitomicaceae bacterium]|nr:GNAT family N-acetyltransferase [Crocinitomicaceae bacterium]
MHHTIRKIKPEDNVAIARVIRSTLEELGCAMEGTVYTDTTTDHLFEYYQLPRRIYYVVELNGEIIGGSGIGPIENSDENYCELQKMYLLPESRGLGIGAELMQLCLDFAKEAGYELVYLETFDSMTAAQKLYKRSGFEYLDHALGNTGHFSCNVKMALKF